MTVNALLVFSLGDAREYVPVSNHPKLTALIVQTFLDYSLEVFRDPTFHTPDNQEEFIQARYVELTEDERFIQILDADTGIPDADNQYLAFISLCHGLVTNALLDVLRMYRSMESYCAIRAVDYLGLTGNRYDVKVRVRGYHLLPAPPTN